MTSAILLTQVVCLPNFIIETLLMITCEETKIIINRQLISDAFQSSLICFHLQHFMGENNNKAKWSILLLLRVKV